MYQLLQAFRDTVKQELDRILQTTSFDAWALNHGPQLALTHHSSQGAWASPVVLATKQDGSVHHCIDYHLLNKITPIDPYSMPRVDNLGDAVYIINP